MILFPKWVGPATDCWQHTHSKILATTHGIITSHTITDNLEHCKLCTIRERVRREKGTP